MNKILATLAMMTAMVQAQELKPTPIPLISVSGEGKVKVTPDQAIITLGVNNTGKDAAEVKKLNDDAVDKVLKVIKAHGIASSDFQTQRVSLYKNYDYTAKKYNYVANQSISIHLKNLDKYDKLMMDLVDSGINSIQGVDFKSSKIEELEAQARQKAMQNAKKRAEDYASVLNQKVGKAFSISDNSQTIYPTAPVYQTYAMAKMTGDAVGSQETLAVGEIEVSSRVSVSFILE